MVAVWSIGGKIGPQMCFCGEASGGGVMKQLVNKDKSRAVAHDGMTGSLLPLSQFGLGFWQAWWTLAFCSFGCSWFRFNYDR